MIVAASLPTLPAHDRPLFEFLCFHKQATYLRRPAAPFYSFHILIVTQLALHSLALFKA